MIATSLDLSTVTMVLQRRFGMNAFISTGFIQRVEEAPQKSQIQTLAVDGNGTLWWNREFFVKNVNTENKLEEVLFHELLHHVFGDFTRSLDALNNIAADMVINATIGRTLGHCDLMKSFYPDALPDKEGGISGLLRPETKVKAQMQKLRPCYQQIWGFWNRTAGHIGHVGQNTEMQEGQFSSIAELIEILRLFLPQSGFATVKLIGSHGSGNGSCTCQKPGDKEDGEGEGQDEQDKQDQGRDPNCPVHGDGCEEISAEVKSRIGKEIADHLEDACKQGGYSDRLTEMVIKTIRCNSTLVSKLLEEFSEDTELAKIKTYYNVRKPKRSVVPRGGIGRRDATLLGAGFIPVFWRMDRIIQGIKHRGLAMYIDVSGSVCSELPRICGLCHAMRREIEDIYQFSNKVVKTSIHDMAMGKLNTTGGTDYNCIIDHAVQNQHRRVLIITDGYAGCDDKRKAMALANIEKAMVIQTKGGTTEEFWNQHYKRSVALDDLFK